MQLLPAVDDLSAKHTDLHMEEERERRGGDGGPPSRWFCSHSPPAPCSTGCLLGNGITATPPPSAPPPSPSLFLHLRGPRGFVSVCSCQMPALCSPPILSVHERHSELGGGGWGGFLWFPSSSMLFGGLVAACVLCYWCFFPTVGAIGWCVQGPAIVPADCWNAGERWSCRPRCPGSIVCLCHFHMSRPFLPLLCAGLLALGVGGNNTVCICTKNKTPRMRPCMTALGRFIKLALTNHVNIHF